MISKKLIFLALIFCFTASLSFADISLNPRDDYRIGVGTVVGGGAGILGLTADVNWYSTINGGISVGSGIHFETYGAHMRYLILDRPLTPYVGGALAYWKRTSDAQKLADKSDMGVKLGLVNKDGTGKRDGVLVVPLSAGVHYISDTGLAVYAEIEYLFSLTEMSTAPYGAIGFQWYF